MRVLIFSTNLSETEECDEILLQMYTGFHGKYPLLLQILMKLEFFDRFSKNIQISKLMKKCPVGAEMFHADGRTNGETDRHDEANSSFTQFC